MLYFSCSQQDRRHARGILGHSAWVFTQWAPGESFDTCMHVCMHSYDSNGLSDLCTYSVHTYMYTHMHTCTYIKRDYTCTCTYTYTYSMITHTHTHTHIHTAGLQLHRLHTEQPMADLWTHQNKSRSLGRGMPCHLYECMCLRVV